MTANIRDYFSEHPSADITHKTVGPARNSAHTGMSFQEVLITPCLGCEEIFTCLGPSNLQHLVYSAKLR